MGRWMSELAREEPPAVPGTQESSGVPDPEDAPAVGRRVVRVSVARRPTHLVCGHAVFPFPELWRTVPPTDDQNKP